MRAPGIFLRLLLLASLLACKSNGATTVTITLRIDDPIFRPEHALITWRVPGKTDRTDIRLPERGSFPDKGAILGSVSFELESSVEGARELEVRGFRGDKLVSGAKAVVPFAKALMQQLTLTLACAEGLEDPVAASACAVVTDGGAPTPDANGPDTRPPSDAGADNHGLPANDAGPDGAPDAPTDAAIDQIPSPDIAAESRFELPPPRDASPEVPGPPDVPVDMRPPSGVDLGTGLVAYLRFDDPAGTLSPAERSGNGLETRLVNLDPARVYTPSPFGTGVTLPAAAAGGFVRVTGVPLNSIEGAITISAWIRTPAGGAGRRTIAARRYVGANGYIYSFHLVGDKPGAYVLFPNGASVDLTSTQAVPANQWVHVAMVYAVGRASLYLGGVAIGSQNFLLSIPSENSALTIGASDDGLPGSVVANDPLGAELDELAVYNRALTPAELTALAGGFQPPVK